MGKETLPMVSLFEIEVKNRIVKRTRRRPIRGTQGQWYHEKFLAIAPDASTAKELVFSKLKERPMLGITRYRSRRHLKREVEVLEIRRLA